jgi:hypothetical protein
VLDRIDGWLTVFFYRQCSIASKESTKMKVDDIEYIGDDQKDILTVLKRSVD